MLANVTNIDTTFHTIPNLKKWTLYFIRVRVENHDHAGPWSVDHNATTQQDGLSTIIIIIIIALNFFLNVSSDNKEVGSYGNF